METLNTARLNVSAEHALQLDPSSFNEGERPDPGAALQVLLRVLDVQWAAFQDRMGAAVLSSYAALPDPIERLSAGVSSLLETIHKWQDGLCGDVLLLYWHDGTGAEQEAALRRLAGEHFTQGVLFHPNRWHGPLEEAFYHFGSAEALGPKEAWLRLAMSAVVLAVHGALDNETPMGAFFRVLRPAIRAEIERSLLDGQTLKEYAGRAEEPWPEHEETLIDAAAELGNVANMTIRQIRALQAVEKLSLREREALLSDGGDGATRTARSRALRKVQRALGM